MSRSRAGAAPKLGADEQPAARRMLIGRWGDQVAHHSVGVSRGAVVFSRGAVVFSVAKRRHSFHCARHCDRGGGKLARRRERDRDVDRERVATRSQNAARDRVVVAAVYVANRSLCPT